MAEEPVSQNLSGQPPTQTEPVAKQEYNFQSKSSKRGFIKKIIIFLIVLLIFAALAIFGRRFYQSWQIKQHDTQRRADIKTLQDALEKLKAKTKDQKYYPSAISETTLVKTGILKKLPKDPRNSSPFIYTYIVKPDGCSATCTSYTLYACLENANDPQGQAPKNACQTKIFEVSK